MSLTPPEEWKLKKCSFIILKILFHADIDNEPATNVIMLLEARMGRN